MRAPALAGYVTRLVVWESLLIFISSIWVWGGIWPSGSWLVLPFPAIAAFIIWRRSAADASAKKLWRLASAVTCAGLFTLISTWLVFCVNPFSSSRLKQMERQKVEYAGQHLLTAIYDKAFEDGKYPESLDELLKVGRLQSPSTIRGVLPPGPSAAEELSWFDYKAGGLETGKDTGVVVLVSKDILHDGSRLLVLSDGKRQWVSDAKLTELRDRIDACKPLARLSQ